jgi:hypothetical protein
MTDKQGVKQLRCRRCGQRFDISAGRGRPPIVCPACVGAERAEQSTHRARRWRAALKKQAEETLKLREQQAHYHAQRLRCDYPEVAEVLMREVPPALAEAIIEELKGKADE